MSFLNGIAKGLGNEYAKLASDGIDAGDVMGFVDTGSYSLNALFSGSIYGGIPSNKITAFAGEEATGKTFFTLGVCKNFLDSNEEAGIAYFESESAISKNMLMERGMDVNRMLVAPVATVQQFRTQAIKTLDAYADIDKKSRPPLMMCLDSLGMLSTSKEMEDSASGSETKDMTRTQVIKSAFRTITLKLGVLNVPLIATNHTYQSMGLYSTKEMSGGSGMKYAASNIVFLSKKKDKSGLDVIGNIITCKMNKSRLTRPDISVDVKLTYDRGLDRHYGLIDMAIDAGLFTKNPKSVTLMDGTTVRRKQIEQESEKYFTPDVLDALDTYTKSKFCYGGGDKADIPLEDDDDE
jgi:RecA/RadA recombinase